MRPTAWSCLGATLIFVGGGTVTARAQTPGAPTPAAKPRFDGAAATVAWDHTTPAPLAPQAASPKALPTRPLPLPAQGLPLPAELSGSLPSAQAGAPKSLPIPPELQPYRGAAGAPGAAMPGSGTGAPGVGADGLGAGVGAGTGLGAPDVGAGLGAPGAGAAPGTDFASLADIGGTGGLEASSDSALVTLGDQNPYFVTAFRRVEARQVPGGPIIPSPGATETPVIRQAFKVAENQTPRPVTRFFYTFNYFNNINGAYNRRLGASFSAVQLYHHTFGYEQAFLRDENDVARASLGIRVPYDRMTRRDNETGNRLTSNYVGNLSLVGKYMFWYDANSLSLATVGLQVTTPTGGGTFADSDVFINNQTVFLQPFLGYRLQFTDRLYLQGFTSLDVPTNGNSAVILYNDVQLAYFLYRSTRPDAFLRAVVPLFEVHVNTPLNYRGFSSTNPFYAIDVVSMTWGGHAVLGDRVTISAGVGTPVTGVNPYDFEALCLFNIALGGRRGGIGAANRLPVLSNL